MKQELLTGFLMTLLCGAVSVPVGVPEAIANQSSSCTTGDTLSKRVAFADLHRAQKILGHKDHWAKQLSDFDMGARQKTTEPTRLPAFLGFAADAGLAWTAQERASWEPLVDKLRKDRPSGSRADEA